MISEFIAQAHEQYYMGVLIAQAEAQAASLELVPLVSRVLHILGALVLGGGIFFLRTVLAPSGEEQWLGERRAAWARWVGIATLVLLATGFYNFMLINGQAKADGGKLPSNYHMLFGIKFLLGLAVMFLGAILAGKTDLAKKFRNSSGKWLNVAWLAVMAIVVIAGVMRTMH